jgi:hypothetical protein
LATYLGRIERTLFTLDWVRDPALRQQVTAGLNKGEAKNSLARAVCFNRLGEIRDRTYDQQRYRASGLNLVIAAIILWNTDYLERAVQALRQHDQVIDERLLTHVAPGHTSSEEGGSPALSMTTRNTLCARGSCRHQPVITKVFHAHKTPLPASQIVAYRAHHDWLGGRHVLRRGPTT